MTNKCRARPALRAGLTLFALALLDARLAAAQNLDGQWLSDGYGYFIEIAGQTLKAAEITSVSCISSFTTTRQAAPPGALAAFKRTDGATTFLLLPGNSDDERRLHRNGAASDIVLRRTAARPSVCDRSTPDTPKTNFEVFAATWGEHYGFFDLKRADWKAIVAANREKVTDSTRPEELFEILKGMVEPFEDAHTNIRATTIDKVWSGTRKSPTWLDRAERAKPFEVIDKNYLRSPLRSWCKDKVQYALLLDGHVGYVRIKSFSDYGDEPGFESGLVALETALDTIFADASKWSGLIIDVRINGGGSDTYGLTIASRLATTEYLAYSKEARSDPSDPGKWTAGQPSRVRPSDRSWVQGAGHRAHRRAQRERGGDLHPGALEARAKGHPCRREHPGCVLRCAHPAVAKRLAIRPAQRALHDGGKKLRRSRHPAGCRRSGIPEERSRRGAGRRPREGAGAARHEALSIPLSDAPGPRSARGHRRER